MTKNPLLQESNLAYGLLDFPSIRLEHVEEAVSEGISRQRHEIEEICAQEEVTWENTVEALEKSGRDLDRATGWFFNLQGTDHTEDFDRVAATIVPALAEHSDWIYQHSELFRRITAVEVPADEQSQRLHKLIMDRFRRRGAELNETQKARLAEINQRLAVLSEEFGRNLLADTRALAVRFDDPSALAGLAPWRIAAAEKDGAWVVPLELPSTQSVQAELENDSARRAVYQASRQRGRAANGPILLETVALRAERASLLGFKNHADYVIDQETAPDTKAVSTLLTDLAPAARANAEAERKLASDLAGHEVDATDWPFYAARLREEDGGATDEEIASYFPLEQVLVDGVFAAAKDLYGINVTRREDLKAYRDDVQVWEITDHDGSGVGLLLTDYFARPSKRGGAWMTSFSDQSQLTGDYPVVVNVMSITRPENGAQPLLSIGEVRTVFHEFGHALHGLLSDVRYPSLSGTNVPRDWVEFPSQYNENFAFDPAIIYRYAKHVETGETIPEDFVDTILERQQAGQGFATAEYLAAAIIDLAWHQLPVEEIEKIKSVEDIDAFEQQVLREAGLEVEALTPRYTSTYFNHIFAGGYSSGYYSYLWAEALDADAFERLKEVGAAGEQRSATKAREAGQKFRDLVLATGASRDYTETFEQLRGRKRSVEALLKRRGLSGTQVQS